MRKAFVTGGAGFLGLNLVEALIRENWDVLVLDRSEASRKTIDKMGGQLILGDITDLESCLQALPSQVDAVFHIAGDVSHWKQGDAQQNRVNIQGTRNMVTAALKQKAKKFVYTSSIAAYGFQPARITEETVSTADDFWLNYFRTKRQAELEVQKGITQGLDAVILNPGNIIGPYDFSGWSRFFHLIKEGKLAGTPSGSASFCHVAEVAKAHIQAAKKGRTGHNYLLGGADATWLEFTQEVGRLLNKKTPDKPIPAFVLRLIGRTSQWISVITNKEPDITPEKAVLVTSDLLCSSEKAIRELDFKTIPLRDMLIDCHRWMIKTGRL